MSRHEIHSLRFDSPADAAHFARHTERVDDPKTSSEKIGAGYDWDMDLGYEGSLDMCEGRTYWDGVSTMMDAMNVTDDMAARSTLPRVIRSRIGGSVSVGAYLSGHPRHMRRRTPQPAVDRPVLTIGVPVSISHSVDTQMRLNFGAAMMSAVDTLEREGYRCELITFMRIGPGASDDLREWVNIETTIKKPDQSWNPSAMAFAIAHPAYLRRVCLKLVETQEPWRQVMEKAYGTPRECAAYNRSCAEDFDVFFPPMNVGTPADTPEQAFEYVEGILNEQITRATAAGRAA